MKVDEAVTIGGLVVVTDHAPDEAKTYVGCRGEVVDAMYEAATGTWLAAVSFGTSLEPVWFAADELRPFRG